MVHDKPRILDLFSGIAGFSLGLEAAGFETVAFCEQSKPCQHLLAHHYPGVPIYDDVTSLTADRLSADGIRVDAICGGFPCQDISFAGLGAGLAGARSGLWSEYLRLIRELRPRVVFVENVAALLSRGLGVVLGDLAESGYDAWWDCIPASAVGAPHRRDRVWIVAYARGEQHEGCGHALRRAIAEELAGVHGLSDGHGTEADPLDTDPHGLGSYRAGMHLDGGPEFRDEQERESEQVRGEIADPAWIQPEWEVERADRERVGPGGEPESEYVADAEGESEREPPDEADPVATRGPSRNEPVCGGQHVADPFSDPRYERRPGDPGEGAGGRDADRGSIGAHVSDAGGVGSQGLGDGREGERASREGAARGAPAGTDRAEHSGGGRRLPLASLGKLVDGIPSRLDGVHGWHSEPETPRVEKDVKGRVHQLHGLGNAVVPAIPALLGRAVMRVFQWS